MGHAIIRSLKQRRPGAQTNATVKRVHHLPASYQESVPPSARHLLVVASVCVEGCTGGHHRAGPIPCELLLPAVRSAREADQTRMTGKLM